VLFADCREYTRLTHELGIEKLAPVTAEFFKTSAGVIREQHGIVDRLLGDAVMAFFNVPIKRGDHVARAAKVGEVRLERAHLGAQDELAVLEHARHGVVDRRPEAAALCRHIDERDRCIIEAGVLVHRARYKSYVRGGTGRGLAGKVWIVGPEIGISGKARH